MGGRTADTARRASTVTSRYGDTLSEIVSQYCIVLLSIEEAGKEAPRLRSYFSSRRLRRLQVFTFLCPQRGGQNSWHR